MSTLLLVHIEDNFRKHWPDFYLETLTDYMKKYDGPIIHCTYEKPSDIIKPFLTGEIYWGWGYEPEVFENQPDEVPWVIESSSWAHEYTWIPHELRHWTEGPVLLGGGAIGECLQDMVCVLNHMNIHYEKVRKLIY